MAKATITVPSTSYAPGSRTVNLPNLTTDDNGILVSLTREAWPDTGSDVISGVIEGSNDAGATWFELTRFSYAGGVMVNPRSSQVVATCGPKVYWPETYDANGVATPKRPGQVRARIINTVTLTTAVTLTGL
jgi:hypothetical protein